MILVTNPYPREQPESTPSCAWPLEKMIQATDSRGSLAGVDLLCTPTS
jgi:hypothetical protein